MKLAFLTYSCDSCGEESPHWPTWREARRAALALGWHLTPEGEPDLCPVCQEDTGLGGTPDA